MTSNNGTQDQIPPYGGSAYGQRLLINVIEGTAKHEPDRVYASIPRSNDLAKGFRDVKFPELLQSIDYYAWWIHDNVGCSDTIETVSYIGVQDLRYVVVFFAAVKCGYKVLLPSPRNSLPMNLSILQQTECTKFLYGKEMERTVQGLQAEKKDLESFAVPPYEETMRRPGKPYPYNKTYGKSAFEPIAVLQSSGSTGPPKPISIKHGSVAVVDQDRLMPTMPGRKNQNFGMWDLKDGRKSISPFPMFHLAGFASWMVTPIYYRTPGVLIPPDRLPTGQLINEIMAQQSLAIILAPPSLFEQLVHEPGSLERCKDLEFICFAGGPLSQSTGDALSKATTVIQAYGVTEMSYIQLLLPLKEDWAYIEPHPLVENMIFEEIEPGMYELVVVRDERLKGYCGIYYTLADVKVWRTKDVFTTHPDPKKKGKLFKFHGRLDDIVVLSNGEKFNPVPMEIAMTGHPLVSGALVVGLRRFQPCCLLELKDPKMNKEAAIDEVWPTMQKANGAAPGHARVTRNLIMIADPNIPFRRAGKGTVIRKLTEADHKADIDMLYSEANTFKLKDAPVLKEPYDAAAVRDLVRACVSPMFEGIELSDSNDFYVGGLDSLRTLEVTSYLKSGLQGHPNAGDASWVNAAMVYSNPTVEKLSAAIAIGLDPTARANGANGISRAERMAALVDKYSVGLCSSDSATNGRDLDSPITVALTGSTGSLGSRLLRILVEDKKVEKVFCLNRSADAPTRQQQALPDLDLSTLKKVTFLHSDFSRSDLGLTDSMFAELKDSVDVVLHNAWKVDFNHALESFEPQLHGLRNIIDICRGSCRQAKIVFVSSISSVAIWNSAQPIPECSLDNYDLPQRMGYAESKFVAEQILVRSGVDAVILRVGQIAGPVKAHGVWNRSDWFPALITSSKTLGAIPDSIPDPDWIPADTLAAIVGDLLFDGTSGLYTLVNPHPTKWSDLVLAAAEWLGAKVVGLEEWIGLLKKVDLEDRETVGKTPAVKILPFYEAMLKSKRVAFETARAEGASRTMSELGPVNKEWLEIWLRQWGL